MVKGLGGKKSISFFWRSGKTNLADYFTKHHPPAHHQSVRGEFLMPVADLLQLRSGGDLAQSTISNMATVNAKSAARVC
jgi:hypothetical protein